MTNVTMKYALANDYLLIVTVSYQQTHSTPQEKQDELISDVFLWTPACDHAKARQPARTYIQQLCDDTGCNPEDLPKAMNDREKWRERVKDIHAGGQT